MTDLPNQRAFHDELLHAISAAARYDEPLALVMLDIDDFKFLNDRYGHPHGDAVFGGSRSPARPAAGTAPIASAATSSPLVLPHTDARVARALTRRLGRRSRTPGSG